MLMTTIKVQKPGNIPGNIGTLPVGELLNRPRPQNQQDIQQAEEDLLIDRNKHTREEIKRLGIFKMS